MLLSQHGRRHQHSDLLSIGDCLKGCSQGNFGLAIADIAAQQAVHGAFGFHVLLDLSDGQQLVRGFDVGEGSLKFTLPVRIGVESVAAGHLPFGIQLQ